jgi:uncharacterized protein YegP (UPF0339 family)
VAGKFELKQGPSGKFMFSLKAGNGQVILVSELYESKAAAEKGIASVRKNADEDGRYERRVASNGEPYFVLKAANGQIIGQSETYSGEAAMENGIASVKNHAPAAELQDTT